MGYDAVALAREIVGSGLSVSEWCRGRGIGRTSAYRALNWCRANEPSVFGAGEEAARASDGRGPWYEAVRKASLAGGEVAQAPSGRFVSLGPAAPASPEPPASPVTVTLGGATVALPAGCAEGDAYVAVSAVARAPVGPGEPLLDSRRGRSPATPRST